MKLNAIDISSSAMFRKPPQNFAEVKNTQVINPKYNIFSSATSATSAKRVTISLEEIYIFIFKNTCIATYLAEVAEVAELRNSCFNSLNNNAAILKNLPQNFAELVRNLCGTWEM